ncbi:hypothetical protein IEN85_05940 [Pelagicoccus sp. NFK12]|uniref:Uncharacterized protein n=1 Tax=Pelagicoccus enzymogenes TaxID=2773457 RepID=A0A927IGC8_9BACT|nr:hypothetical protein [Pelagicoccus enzymogenes]MBD5779026.1 hypothetical protein [Pelagicoccus enzymogenes]
MNIARKRIAVAVLRDRLVLLFCLIASLVAAPVWAAELDLLELTGVFEFGGSTKVSLSHKQNGHLGWIEVGRERMGIAIVSASLSPPSATVARGGDVKKIQLREAKVRPLNLAQKVRERRKSEAEISFDATMVMSFERVQELRKENARKRREALLSRSVED